MRHAIIMTMHTNEKILQMFVDLFDDERFDFYVLIDKKSSLCENDVIKNKPKYSKIFSFRE